jgi:death on curing protein
VKFRYISTEVAINIHNNIISITSGLYGTINEGALESVLMHIQNDNYYPDFLNKLTHLVFGLIQNHPFVDGNKRTSLALGAYFLQINGYSKYVDSFIVKMEKIVVEVASKIIDKDKLKVQLRTIIMH